jgi:hypothetical protein
MGHVALYLLGTAPKEPLPVGQVIHTGHLYLFWDDQHVRSRQRSFSFSRRCTLPNISNEQHLYGHIIPIFIDWNQVGTYAR